MSFRLGKVNLIDKNMSIIVLHVIFQYKKSSHPFETIIFEFLDHENHKNEVLDEKITVLLAKLWVKRDWAAILDAILNLTHLMNFVFWAPTPKPFNII